MLLLSQVNLLMMLKKSPLFKRWFVVWVQGGCQK